MTKSKRRCHGLSDQWLRSVWKAIPSVSEDEGMIGIVKWLAQFRKLEAMTAIYLVGLDMIAIPEATPAETIAAMIADEAASRRYQSEDDCCNDGSEGKEGVIWLNLADSWEQPGHEGQSGGFQVSFAFIARRAVTPAPIHSLKTR